MPCDFSTVPDRPRAGFLFVLLAFILFLFPACGGGDSDDDPDDPGISWKACGENLECGSLAVPLDYEDPSGARIDLALVRMPATDPSRRIGSVVTNPGGPGGSGVDFLTHAGAHFFPASLREWFDIVSFDPRGVGASSPVRCLDDLDAYLATDLTPDNETEYEAMVENARRMADACWEKNSDLLRHVGTKDVVQDLERIRVALGGELLNYVGLSYGTKIGALYAERYPEKVRAMVLDGVVPPSMETKELDFTQTAGLESAMGAFLAWCDGTADCAFGAGDSSSAFKTLMFEIDRQPLFTGERSLGPGEAAFGVALGLYSRDWWPDLADALAALNAGEPDSLLFLSDSYIGRSDEGTYKNTLEANLAVNCIDQPWPSLEDARALAQQADEQFPYFGSFNLHISLPCTVWPVEPVSEPEIVRGAGAPPVMLIGTTNDPATPYDWAVLLADQMESAVLVTLEGEGHVGMGRRNPCLDQTVDDYLTALIIPEENKRCEE